MSRTERIMIEEILVRDTGQYREHTTGDSRTTSQPKARTSQSIYTVLTTTLKEGVPEQNWREISEDDFSWWNEKKETEQSWTERKLRRELELSPDVPLIEGMVFIRIIDNGKIKEVIPYTPQARAASKKVYEEALKK